MAFSVAYMSIHDRTREYTLGTYLRVHSILEHLVVRQVHITRYPHDVAIAQYLTLLIVHLTVELVVELDSEITVG